MQNLRRQFRAGEKPVTCNRCWQEEDAGRASKRIYSKIRLKELADQVDYANDTPDQLWFVDLKLGNICNLKCRICGSWSSSKWAQEEIDYLPELKNKKERKLKNKAKNADKKITVLQFQNYDRPVYALVCCFPCN